MGKADDENQITGYARSGMSGALPDPGSTPGASTKANDLAERGGRRRRVNCPERTPVYDVFFTGGAASSLGLTVSPMIGW